MTLPAWQISGGSIGVAVIGQPFSVTLLASNALSFSVISGNLPQGLTLSNSGLISGTVTNVNVDSDVQFVVRATNLSGVADRTFIINTVSPNSLQWITPQGFVNVGRGNEFYVINKTRVAYDFRAGPGVETQLSAVASTGTTTLYLNTLTYINLGSTGLWREIAGSGIAQYTTITSITTSFDMVSQGYAIEISNPTQYAVTATITVYDQLPETQRVDYYLADTRGQLPPGLVLDLRGHLSGYVTDRLSIDTRMSTGGYDNDSYSAYPYDHAVLVNGLPIRVISRYIPKVYQFSIVASTGFESTTRDFNILVVDPSNLKTDGVFSDGSGPLTAPAGFIVPVEWLEVTPDGTTGTAKMIS
jgi:hypothetical protein